MDLTPHITNNYDGGWPTDTSTSSVFATSFDSSYNNTVRIGESSTEAPTTVHPWFLPQPTQNPTQSPANNGNDFDNSNTNRPWYIPEPVPQTESPYRPIFSFGTESPQQPDYPTATQQPTVDGTTYRILANHEPTRSPSKCRADDVVRCADGSAIICADQQCDGVRDCPGGDDEDNCQTGIFQRKTNQYYTNSRRGLELNYLKLLLTP